MENKIHYNFESEIQVGNTNYNIIKDEVDHTSSELNLDQIISNVWKLREKSDIFLQQIIDNNKFLLTIEKKGKKDDEEEENIEDEN